MMRHYVVGCAQALLALVFLYPFVMIFNNIRKRGWFLFG
jgi:hypothetical protein